MIRDRLFAGSLGIMLIFFLISPCVQAMQTGMSELCWLVAASTHIYFMYVDGSIVYDRRAVAY